MTILLSTAGVSDMPDSEGRTALMWAAQRGNYKVLEVMLEGEVDVHAFDHLGGTGRSLAYYNYYCMCLYKVYSVRSFHIHCTKRVHCKCMRYCFLFPFFSPFAL